MAERSHSVIKRRGAESLRGFTLVELMIVIVLLGISASLVISLFEPSVQAQLTSAADVLAADLAYARNLSVSNNSSYRIEFDADENLYRLTHVGADASFDVLPASPFESETPNSQVMRFADLPRLGPPVQLLGVWRVADGSQTETGDIRFTSLGGTDSPQVTRIWLTTLEDNDRLGVPIQIDPVTGLSEVGSIRRFPASQATGGDVKSELIEIGALEIAIP